jgi:tetratricopeptide (TPR) repeat protein
LHNENYEAICLNNIGNVYLATARYDDALTYFQQALQVVEKLNLTGEIPGVLANVGEASLRLGQYDPALNSYERALELARKAGDKQFISIASYGMGTVFEHQGRYGAAVSARGDALKSYRELQDRSALMAQMLTGYGHTLVLVGRNEDAKKILEEAVSLAREIKNDLYIAQALAFEGQGALYAGDSKAARSLAQQALSPATRSKDRETPHWGPGT